jgi:hypothetical protein
MTELGIRAIGARTEPHAAVPTLLFDLALEETTGQLVESIALRCQIRIEPHRRRYSPEEQHSLLELFGETPRWGDTLKPFLWTHASTIVPRFSGSTRAELPVTCTYDFEVAASKYLHALEGGEIPTLLLFSGTVFVQGPTGLSVSQIPWEKEASFRLPVRVWREMMDRYFPNSGWLRLQTDTLDLLMRCKARRAVASWDQLVVSLLKDAGETEQ